MLQKPTKSPTNFSTKHLLLGLICALFCFGGEVFHLSSYQKAATQIEEVLTSKKQSALNLIFSFKKIYTQTSRPHYLSNFKQYTTDYLAAVHVLYKVQIDCSLIQLNGLPPMFHLLAIKTIPLSSDEDLLSINPFYSFCLY